MDDISFRPDMDNLDKDWLNMPDLIADAARKVSKLEIKLLKAEQVVSQRQYKLSTELKLTPELHNFKKKPADTTIKDLVRGNKRVSEAEDEVIYIKSKLGIAKVDLQGYLEMRRSLENLVVLHGQGYFGEPRDKTGKAREMIRGRRDAEEDEVLNAKKKKRRDK